VIVVQEAADARVGSPEFLSLMMMEQRQHKRTTVLAMTAPNQGNQSGYIPTLDGWRAVAIFWVLEGHSRPLSVAGISNHWLRETGYRGVQLFFALSGFLICTRLLREEDRFGGISSRSFYTRRLFRIQPAAMTYLAALALLSFFGVIPIFWPGIGGAALMIRNLWPITLAPGYWYTAHFWSLAVEEHFYLLLPGFLVLFRRRRLAILSAIGLALQIWGQIVMRTPQLQRGLEWQVAQRTDVVISGILLGSVFSVALTYKRLFHVASAFLRPCAATLYTLFIFFELQRHHSSTAQAVLITVYPVLIVATALHPDTVLGRFLELPPVRFIGRISYSLYLWQELFFRGDDLFAQGSLRSHVFICWCATFACAIASYYLIETPLIRKGHRIASRFDRHEAVQVMVDGSN
jgi:peptidoglycan/LPS O-acetylase OafA/YrhL